MSQRSMSTRTLNGRTIGLAATAMLCSLSAHAERTENRLQLNGVTLIVSHEASLTAMQLDKIISWLDNLTANMLLLHGNPPHETLRIDLESFSRSTRAVPFGRVIRQRTPGVKFYVNPNLPLESFLNDWIPYHEVSHLFIPYPGKADIWFSEGLASYYQNVLRYRAGILSGTDTWKNLLNGFKRARDDTRHTELTLEELSTELRTRHAYMRVYWSGALYFLEADIQLRNQTGNKQSVDTVLGDFGNCCLKRRQKWTGQEIAQTFDKLSDNEIFESLYIKYAQSKRIPDYEAILSQAGIQVIADNITDTSTRPTHDLGGLAGPADP